MKLYLRLPLAVCKENSCLLSCGYEEPQELQHGHRERAWQEASVGKLHRRDQGLVSKRKSGAEAGPSLPGAGTVSGCLSLLKFSFCLAIEKRPHRHYVDSDSAETKCPSRFSHLLIMRQDCLSVSLFSHLQNGGDNICSWDWWGNHLYKALAMVAAIQLVSNE